MLLCIFKIIFIFPYYILIKCLSKHQIQDCIIYYVIYDGKHLFKHLINTKLKACLCISHSIFYKKHQRGWSLHVLFVPVEFFGFLPPSKGMQTRWTRDSEIDHDFVYITFLVDYSCVISFYFWVSCKITISEQSLFNSLFNLE